jgi:thioredoxin reductase (NADPH)
VGGQAGASARIENYLGFPSGLAGAELTAKAPHEQARWVTSLTPLSIDG